MTLTGSWSVCLYEVDSAQMCTYMFTAVCMCVCVCVCVCEREKKNVGVFVIWHFVTENHSVRWSVTYKHL